MRAACTKGIRPQLMTRFLSRGLLVNIAVVLAALGANAFVACERIGGLRDSDASTLRSMSLLRDLSEYRGTLGESLTQLSRFEATGVAETATRHQEREANLDALESGLRAQSAIEPGMTGAFEALAARAAVMHRDANHAFERTRRASPGESRAWADAAFVHTRRRPAGRRRGNGRGALAHRFGDDRRAR